eukprot:365476-Chlamydomonas_euryale.AAC.3
MCAYARDCAGVQRCGRLGSRLLRLAERLLGIEHTSHCCVDDASHHRGHGESVLATLASQCTWEGQRDG